MGDGYNFARYELQEITARIIERDNLSPQQARSKNENEGWQIEGFGSYRLSVDHVNAALKLASGDSPRYSYPELDKLTTEERFADVAHSIVRNEQPRSYGDAQDLNNSPQGWVVPEKNFYYKDNPMNEAVMRFSPKVLERAWERTQANNIHDQLYLLTSNIIYEKHLSNLPDSTYAHLIKGARKINEGAGWTVEGSSYRLSAHTLDFALMDARDRIDWGVVNRSQMRSSDPSDPSNTERLTKIGIALLDGKHFTLEEARLENKRGWNIPDTASIRLSDQVLEAAYARTQAMNHRVDRQSAREPEQKEAVWNSVPQNGVIPRQAATLGEGSGKRAMSVPERGR